MKKKFSIKQKNKLKLTKKKCDILSNFVDQGGRKVISNVFKCDVMIKQNHLSEKRKLFNEEKVFFQAKKINSKIVISCQIL